ncbi:coiled-coil domain-containing protein 22 [Citrobacter braakii]|nr:coiled-coil domain-containing protein 22 [Citrobacter braakii]
MEKVIEITARREGFRRCGMAHSATTQRYPVDHFTPEQLAELKSESNLIVVVRTKHDSGDQRHDELKNLRQQIGTLEARVKTLETELDTERVNVSQLTVDLDAEREKTKALTADLEAEQKKVAELTTQLDAAKVAAEKKGK